MPPAHFSYRQVAADLAARIESGEYPPGSKLPSYKEIRELYNVGVTTAQSAIRELRAMGLVDSIQGVGVFVAGAPNG